MSDPYASIDQADTQIQERLANVLELRAANAQQRAMLDCYLADFNLQNEARVLEIGCGNAERCAGGYMRDKESCGCTYA